MSLRFRQKCCGLFLIGASISYWGCGKTTGAGAAGPTAPGAGGKKGGGDAPVTLTKVMLKDVPMEVQVIGNVEALAVVTVKAQVGGELIKVHFNEGDYVRKGDLLFTIDRRPLEGALRQAEANLLKDLAMQGQAEANLAREKAQEKYVRSQADRYGNLFKEGLASKDQAELFRTNADVIASAINADQAAIESAKASVEAGRAMVQNAKTQLNYTEIRSSVDGRTGHVTVKQGNVISAATPELVTINQVQPIYVTFSIPESALGDVKKYMAQGKLQVVAVPQEDGGTPHTGVLTFVDNSVDPTTGTIKLKATFPNTDRKLWPGQFVRVTLRLTTMMNSKVVPNQAVQTGQEGLYVYVVKEDSKAEMRPVLTGARIDQDLVILKGLEVGETVVVDGHLRIAPGMRVQDRGKGKRKSGGDEKGKEGAQ